MLSLLDVRSVATCIAVICRPCGGVFVRLAAAIKNKCALSAASIMVIAHKCSNVFREVGSQKEGFIPSAIPFLPPHLPFASLVCKHSSAPPSLPFSHEAAPSLSPSTTKFRGFTEQMSLFLAFPHILYKIILCTRSPWRVDLAQLFCTCPDCQLPKNSSCSENIQNRKQGCLFV